MTTFPRSPKLTKGAIVGLDPASPLASVIIFQYNPASLSLSPQAQTKRDGRGKSEMLRLSGSPSETLTISALGVDMRDHIRKYVRAG